MQQSQQKGFSLIEILIAIVILSVVALGIMALLPGGYKQITNAGRSATLNHLAQMQMDNLRSIPITHNDLAIGTHPSPWGPDWPMTNGSADKFSVHWVVEDYTSLTNARSVTVVAGYDIWDSAGAAKPDAEAIEQKRVTLTTLITQ